MGFDMAALERRIAALEANRGASLRFGTVVGIGEDGGSARVQLHDGDGMVTYPLRVLQKRTGPRAGRRSRSSLFRQGAFAEA